MTDIQEWSRVWHHPRLDLELFQAYYTEHAYPRHSHDYYVICLIRRGYQAFTHRVTKYSTPPGGLILINPEEAHTGEAAGDRGFEMICLYPTAAHMLHATADLTGRGAVLPFFKEVRVDDARARQRVLEAESRFHWMLAQLVRRYADNASGEVREGNERQAVRQAREFLEDEFSRDISLSELAQLVSLSPTYLLRAFSAEVGMPPHAYLISLRIRRARALIESGLPLAEIAAQSGFRSQSHIKQVLGLIPGQYVRQLR